MERNSLNEALKRKAAEAQEQTAEKEQALDDSRRVKVLSPGRLVVKRFFRNRLAMIGLVVLIAIFLFCYVGPFFYEYGETQVFKHYDYLVRTYATANFNTEFNQTAIPDAEELPGEVRRMTNSRILSMTETGSDYSVNSHTAGDTNTHYLLRKTSNHVYQWSVLSDKVDGRYAQSVVIASEIDNIKNANGATADDGTPIEDALLNAAKACFKTIKTNGDKASFEYNGTIYNVIKTGKQSYSLEAASPSFIGMEGDETLLEAANAAAASGVNAFTAADGTVYAMKEVSKGVYDLEIVTETVPVALFSDYTFKLLDKATVLSPELKAQALLNEQSNESFMADGLEYRVDAESGEIFTADGTGVAMLTNISVVDANAQDSFTVEFVDALTDILTSMKEQNQKEASMVWSLQQKEPSQNENGEQILLDKVDENGNPVYADETLQISELVGTYTISRNMPFWVNKSYAPMSNEHPFGTDGNGMDMLARMMYGGRISLMVGFVVVILSMIIGVTLGGIAGYFGGWVDTLIMRLVEIFYCIPSYPILIILGGYMDAMRMDARVRLYAMMAVLGILSWAGVARLVRGQILSLREQEFMVATEATGTKVRHRIFRHLVPNVMPQLIVSATGSLGGVILTESSLSFLGLGVKFPLATWGNMIEFVTGLNENLGRYIYIWLPVGLLICFTVISFNFVGDGLRDAFDPKMKR